MGENLRLQERDAIRTPMQWSDAENAGFSTASSDHLIRPVITDGDFAYRNVNVARQRREADSLLLWMQRVLRAMRECPEVGEASCEVIDSRLPAVLVYRFSGPNGAMLFVHNLDDVEQAVDVSAGVSDEDEPSESFSDADYGELPRPLIGLRVNGYGYRWIRLRFVP